MKNKYIFSIALIFMISILRAESNNHWCLKAGVSGMKPFFENDQWFVTEDGYHFHPRTEDFTPGLYLGFERYITTHLSIELGVLAAFPPATLGVIDQYSSTGREFLGTEKYIFTALTINPQILLFMSKKIQLYGGPIIGVAISSEKELIPSFGESIKWTQHSELIYGGKIGIKIGTNNQRVSILSEIFMLSINANLEATETGNVLNKYVGPLGVLLGINYSF